MISTTYPRSHLERSDCFAIFVRHRLPLPAAARSSLARADAASFCGHAEIMRVKDSLNVHARVPCDAAALRAFIRFHDVAVA
jgi:hypothetical protein